MRTKAERKFVFYNIMAALFFIAFAAMGVYGLVLMLVSSIKFWIGALLVCGAIVFGTIDLIVLIVLIAHNPYKLRKKIRYENPSDFRSTL